MFQELTIFILGLVTGLFGLVAALYLFVFKRSRIRLVLGVILAVYALYLFKDLLYIHEAVADNPFIYKLLLSIDTWAVPLYVMFAFEFLYPGKMTLRYPGKMTLRKDLLLFGSFPLFTLLYVLYPYDWVYSLMTVYAVVFSGVCICIVLRKTLLYRRMLKGSLSDITHMDVKWLWVSIALLLPNLVLWAFVSSRTDNLLDAVYYLSLSVTWGIIAYKIYYYKYPSASDLMSGDAHAEAVHAPSHFSEKLVRLAADGYFVRTPHLTLAELAAELGTNRTTLSSYINSSLGTTFYDYVNSSRLEYTEKLLSDPDAKYSVEQLAELSGFNSLSTFRRAFGKKYGSTVRGCWKGVDLRFESIFTL